MEVQRCYMTHPRPHSQEVTRAGIQNHLPSAQFMSKPQHTDVIVNFQFKYIYFKRNYISQQKWNTTVPC